MLVLVRLSSLHDNHAFLVSWDNGALRGDCRRTHGKTSFSPFSGFLLCRNSLYRFWRVILCTSGWVGLDIQVLILWEFRLSCSMLLVV